MKARSLANSVKLLIFTRPCDELVFAVRTPQVDSSGAECQTVQNHQASIKEDAANNGSRQDLGGLEGDHDALGKQGIHQHGSASYAVEPPHGRKADDCGEPCDSPNYAF